MHIRDSGWRPLKIAEGLGCLGGSDLCCPLQLGRGINVCDLMAGHASATYEFTLDPLPTSSKVVLSTTAPSPFRHTTLSNYLSLPKHKETLWLFSGFHIDLALLASLPAKTFFRNGTRALPRILPNTLIQTPGMAIFDRRSNSCFRMGSRPHPRFWW